MAQEGCQGYTRARYNRAAAVTRSCFLHGPLKSEPSEPGLAAVNGLAVWEGERGIKCGCYGTLRGEEGGGWSLMSCALGLPITWETGQ